MIVLAPTMRGCEICEASHVCRKIASRYVSRRGRQIPRLIFRAFALQEYALSCGTREKIQRITRWYIGRPRKRGEERNACVWRHWHTLPKRRVQVASGGDRRRSPLEKFWSGKQMRSRRRRRQEDDGVTVSGITSHVCAPKKEEEIKRRRWRRRRRRRTIPVASTGKTRVLPSLRCASLSKDKIV